MTDAWEDFDKKMDQAGGGAFIQLKNDGDSIVGVFRGTPYTFFSKYGDKKHYQEQVEETSPKFQINFVTKNDKGEYEARIFEQGSTTGKRMRKMLVKHSFDCVFEIERDGAKGDQKTIYHITHKSDLTKKALEQIDAVTLHELGGGRGRKADSQPPIDEDVPEQGGGDDDDIPF